MLPRTRRIVACAAGALLFACSDPPVALPPDADPPPSVIEVLPADGDRGVPVDTPVVVRFTEPVRNAFLLGEYGDYRTFVDGAVVRFELEAPLPWVTRIELATRAIDEAGESMREEFRWSFETVAPPWDACVSRMDGECDEPARCALGTDSTDCAVLCASGEQAHLFRAACHHRELPVEPPAPPPGTGGSEHATGHRDGILRVRNAAGVTVDRHYRLYVPAAYDPARPAPLVVVMPGHRADLYGLADYTQLLPTAEANRFLVAFAEQEWRETRTGPNDWVRRWAWYTEWVGTGGPCLDGRPEQNPDLAYLRALVEAVGDAYNVDRSRVFATGHSRGASMAIVAAIELPEIFAGAVSQSGFLECGYPARLAAYTGPRRPIYLFHGTLDADVPVGRSDQIAATLRERGWRDGEDLVYRRLGRAAHRWQPFLNQEWWDFLSARPLPEVSP